MGLNHRLLKISELGTRGKEVIVELRIEGGAWSWRELGQLPSMSISCLQWGSKVCFIKNSTVCWICYVDLTEIKELKDKTAKIILFCFYVESKMEFPNSNMVILMRDSEIHSDFFFQCFFVACCSFSFIKKPIAIPWLLAGCGGERPLSATRVYKSMQDLFFLILGAVSQELYRLLYLASKDFQLWFILLLLPSLQLGLNVYWCRNWGKNGKISFPNSGKFYMSLL